MDDYEINVLERQFERVGANLRVETMPIPRFTGSKPRYYMLDVRDLGRRKGETFVMRVRTDAMPHAHFQVLNAHVPMRHLLLHAIPDSDAMVPQAFVSKRGVSCAGTTNGIGSWPLSKVAGRMRRQLSGRRWRP